VTGVIHAGGEGECSWCEFAKAILQEAGLGCRVVPISTAESDRLARRPPYSALSTAFLRQYGLSLPPWREGIRQFLVDQHAH
jgi:dTDP-4-dehydrorhamnose reductase